MSKHGARQHFMRPDGVMYTAVVQPTAGFHPVRDAMGVAAEFTSGLGKAHAPKANTFARGGIIGWLRGRNQRRQFVAAIPALIDAQAQREAAAASTPRGDGGYAAAPRAGMDSVALDITRASTASAPTVNVPFSSERIMAAGTRLVPAAYDATAELIERIGSQIPGVAVAAGTRAAWVKFFKNRGF